MKQHAFDTVSFVSGIVVTAIGLLFLIPDSASEVIDAITRMGVWFWPVLFLAIGLAVIIPVLVPKKETDVDQAELES